MKRIFWCLGASALWLSGCNNANQTVSEPAPQKITEAAPTSAAVNENTAAMAAATPSAGAKLTKRVEGVAAFDVKQFKVARTLELPNYNDQIWGFVFSPDGKTVAGFGRGRIISKTEGGERGVAFLFDVKSGALLKRLASDALPNAQGSGPNFDRAIWSPGGKFLAAWNVDSSGSGGALCVWDVGSGKRTAVFRNFRLSVTNAAWMNDGSLLVARYDPTGNLNINGQLMVCNGQTGQINNVYDLEDKSVASIHVPKQGLPQLLILQSVGEKRSDREPDVQGSIRSFGAGTLGGPTLQLPIRHAFLSAAWSDDGRVALSGIEQGNSDPVAGVYAVGNWKTGKIAWQNKRAPSDFSLQISLLPDEKHFWARTSLVGDDIIFDMASGQSSSAPTKQFPFFAPDGKRFVRLLDSGKHAPNGQLLPNGQKPHLKIAEIWER